MIGVFDSGVGGLSVLREIRAALPTSDLVYVADRARSPYGTRSLEDVETISGEVAGWLVVFADKPAAAVTLILVGGLVNTLFISNYLRPKLAAERSRSSPELKMVVMRFQK